MSTVNPLRLIIKMFHFQHNVCEKDVFDVLRPFKARKTYVGTIQGLSCSGLSGLGI